MPGCVGGHEREDHDGDGGEDGAQVEAPQGDVLVFYPVGLPYHEGASDDWETDEHAEQRAGVADVDSHGAGDKKGEKGRGASATEEQECLQSRILCGC